MDRIGAVIDWQQQRADFEIDGSLRDIYVLNATVDDWSTVAALLARDHNAQLFRGDIPIPMPASLEPLFDEDGERHRLSFSIEGVDLECHFFTPSEIELSFDPDGVDEEVLRALLALLIALGEATGKTVLLTPESCPELPIFTYDAHLRALRWHPPGSGG